MRLEPSKGDSVLIWWCWLWNPKLFLRYDSSIWKTFFNRNSASRTEFLNGYNFKQPCPTLVFLSLESPGMDCGKPPWPPATSSSFSVISRRVSTRNQGAWLSYSPAQWQELQKPIASASSLIFKAEISFGSQSRPEFPSFVSCLISSVTTCTPAQVHGKWSISVNDFFIYVRERTIRQIQRDSSGSLSVPVTFGAGCAVERDWKQTGQDRRSSGRNVSHGEKPVRVKSSKWPAPRAAELRSAVCQWTSLSVSLSLPAAVGRMAKSQVYLGCTERVWYK